MREIKEKFRSIKGLLLEFEDELGNTAVMHSLLRPLGYSFESCYIKKKG